MKIESISTKTVTTKFGPKPTYSVKADGEWYSAGFKKPAYKEGDDVQFTFTEDKYGKKIDETSVRVIASGSGSPSTASTSPVSSAGKGDVATASSGRSYGPPAKVFPIPALHGDRAIVRQNSLTNAVNLLREDKEALKLGAEQRAELVINVARMFEAYSCGDLDMQAAAEIAKESE